jgi:glycine cleavage system aminomethyltransferase T
MCHQQFKTIVSINNVVLHVGNMQYGCFLNKRSNIHRDGTIFNYVIKSRQETVTKDKEYALNFDK